MPHRLTWPELFKVKDLNASSSIDLLLLPSTFNLLSLHTCHCYEQSRTRDRGGGHVRERRVREKGVQSTEKWVNRDKNQLDLFSSPCSIHHFNIEVPSSSLWRIKQTRSIFKFHHLVCSFSSVSAAVLSHPSPFLVFSSPLTFLRKWC